MKQFSQPEIDQLFDKYNTKKDFGLNPSKILQLQKLHGKNQITFKQRSHILIEFLKNFLNPLIIILLLISIVSFILGDTINGIIVLLMLFLSVSLNFFQEHKANNAAQKLEEKVALTSTVIRNGKQQDIRASQICIGDILVLNAGDLIPADAILYQTKDFFVNQSVLTGESYPVEKNEHSLESRQIFSGTSVTTGTARAVVTAIGKNTEYGKIATDLNKTEEENNFSKGIKEFSYFILRIVVTFVFIIFLITILIRHDFLSSLTFAIAIAVGLTPEFLPMIITVTTSKGALLMSKKGVIVKKLSAIPTFGSMNILCTDKTGTITEDKISLVKYIDIMGNNSPHILELAYVNSSFQTGITNPMDLAITNYQKLDIKNYKKIDEIPFDFNRRCMSIVADHGHNRTIITKGAPESVLNQSKFMLIRDTAKKITKQNREIFIKLYQNLSKEGYRVLAIATKNIKENKKVFTKEDENDLTIVGFTAFLDPVKHNAKEAIDALENIGIEIKVVTGDNEYVTQKACFDAGILVKGVLLGSEIKQMPDDELAKIVPNTTIFARFSPMEKERIIKILKTGGNVVGYMGDGINDSPSIKAADVGISVSNAVDVAKESADFILTHKSLMELKDGVIEGRIIFGNTMKYIEMGLSSNFGNMFSVLGAVLFLPFLPMLPIQILLNNFLYDLSQITIPGDSVDDDYLLKPKKWDVSFIRKFMLSIGPISSLMDFLTFIVLFIIFKNNPSAFQTGWFLESLATQTLVIHIIRTKKIPFIQSTASIPLIISTLLIVSIGWLIPYSPVAHLFSFTPLPTNILLILSLIVGIYLVSVETGKKLFYKNLSITSAKPSSSTLGAI